jgi:hypothetical protein
MCAGLAGGTRWIRRLCGECGVVKEGHVTCWVRENLFLFFPSAYDWVVKLLFALDAILSPYGTIIGIGKLVRTVAALVARHYLVSKPK